MKSLTFSVSLIAVAACGGVHAGPPIAAADAPYDLLITNGRVVDGTGAAWFLGDVAVRGDRIVRVVPAGVLRGAKSARTIDATGLVVAPGFIDIQGQSYDNFLMGDGRVISKVTQGITTEILGEGTTPAPLTEAMYGWMFSDSAGLRLAPRFAGSHGFGNWLDAMAAHSTSPNVGSFLGAETVRMYAKGKAQGPASPAELDTMRAVTRRAMEDGAFGVGSALIYPPGAYASTDELIEIARAMAPYGGLYITHMRSEGDRLLEGVAEAIRIGREGGVPVEIYHLKAAGQRNWSKAPRMVAMIDSARRAGQDVSADMYPYTAGMTSLASCTPPWASADGKLLSNLADAAIRARVKSELLAGVRDAESLCELATPHGVMVTGFRDSTLKKFEGMRLDDIARAMNEDWTDALIDLTLREKARLGGIFFLASDENLRMQLKQPWMKFGTDAEGWDPDSARGQMTHPRAYGTYAQLLGQLSRDEGLMPLEEVVRKATSAVATRLSIPNRGLLRAGLYADIVVFDPGTVMDRATYAAPHHTPAGIREVFVNGVEVVRDGVHTGAKPGRIVRGAGANGRR